jgi:hypothetical protein
MSDGAARAAAVSDALAFRRTRHGASLSGDGWRAELAPGWVARPGTRAGDFVVIREKQE